MKTKTDNPKTDYYWKCYAEAETAQRMAENTWSDQMARRYEKTAKTWNAKAKRAARMTAAAA